MVVVVAAVVGVAVVVPVGVAGDLGPAGEHLDEQLVPDVGAAIDAVEERLQVAGRIRLGTKI